MPQDMQEHAEDESVMTPLVYRELITRFVRDNKLLLAAFSLFVFLTFPVESVVLPHFYSKLFDGIKDHLGKLSGIFENVVANWQSGNAAGIFYRIVLIWIGVTIAYSIKQSVESVLVPKYLSYVRQLIFSRIIEKHQDNFKDVRVGEEISRILDVSRNMRDLLSWGLDELAPMFVTMCIIAIFFCTIHLSIGGAMLTGLAATLLVLRYMGRRGIDAAARRENYYMQMSEKLHDSFSNLMNIYINNTKDKEVQSNASVEKMHTDLYTKQMQITRNIVVVLSIVSVVTFLSTLIIAYYLVKNGSISNTTFVSLWIVLIYYIGFMVRFSAEFPHFFVKFGIVKNSKEFLHSILAFSTARTVQSGIESGEVRFRDVHFTYPGATTPTLQGFNMHVRPREKVALLGSSGSGKTTAMKLLSGIHRATDGEVRVDGVSLDEADLVYLRNRVNYVNQRTQLFHDTVLKNMQYGNDTSEDEIRTILRRHHLESIFGRLKNGIQSSAGVNGGSLSLGMQKVTILMRGLLRPDARVIILDEPLAGLDAHTRRKVISLIKERSVGKTLIVITHDKEIVPMMDRVVNFSNLNRTATVDASAQDSAQTPDELSSASMM